VTGREAVGERGAFEVVDRFEEAVARYTGARYCVTVDSCTNAIFLALSCRMKTFTVPAVLPWTVQVPRKTYVGVAQALLNAGFEIEWIDKTWRGGYHLDMTGVVDMAKRFTSGMYPEMVERVPSFIPLVCVSFQAGKILPIGRGGAILTDDLEAVEWLRRARHDGRAMGSWQGVTWPGWHMYMTPPDAPDQPTDDYPNLEELMAQEVTR
jgi:dTDP-4-amino-4,6-dideoxygalactose transaminase